MTELPPIIVWNLIEALSDVADGPYQTRLWQASEGEVSTFDEALEVIFGDTGIGRDLDKGSQVTTQTSTPAFSDLISKW